MQSTSVTITRSRAFRAVVLAAVLVAAASFVGRASAGVHAAAHQQKVVAGRSAAGAHKAGRVAARVQLGRNAAGIHRAGRVAARVQLGRSAAARSLRLVQSSRA